MGQQAVRCAVHGVALQAWRDCQLGNCQGAGDPTGIGGCARRARRGQGTSAAGVLYEATTLLASEQPRGACEPACRGVCPANATLRLAPCFTVLLCRALCCWLRLSAALDCSCCHWAAAAGSVFVAAQSKGQGKGQGNAEARQKHGGSQRQSSKGSKSGKLLGQSTVALLDGR